MPFLVPQVARVGAHYDGRKPLPRRAELVVRREASDKLTLAQLAKHTGVSERSISRLRTHAAYQSRLAYLQERAAERAQRDEPLALKGNRIALAGAMARTLRDQLERNDYVTTLGVSKQGNPIVGFDRARVAEIRQYLALIADELEDKTAKGSTDALAVSVTMTTDQAVTKVQALLSRAAPIEAGSSTIVDADAATLSAIEERARAHERTHAHAHAREADPQAPPMPLGYGGVSSETGTLEEIVAVPDTEYPKS